MDTAGEKIAFRIDEAVSASGLSRSTIYELIAARKLVAFRACGRRLILRSDLESFLQRARDREDLA